MGETGVGSTSDGGGEVADAIAGTVFRKLVELVMETRNSSSETSAVTSTC